MVEFEVDMGYLEKYGELDYVILYDENGEMEPRKFIPAEERSGFVREEQEFCRNLKI